MKRITLEELKNELKDYVLSVFDEYIEEHGEGTDASFFVHWFETTYMQQHIADMHLDHATFRIFLRKIITQFYTKKEVDKKLNDQKWFLLDFINESILTALPYKDADGNILITKPVEELIGRVLYDAQTGELFQFRDDAEGNITTYVLFGEDLRDNQIVFLENMPTLEDSIYYMKDGKLESFLASHEHAGLMSAEDKEKLDSINPDDYLKEVSIEGTNLPKENGVVDIPKATDTTLGVVKGGENVEIGADGSINVDIPVSIDEVVNLRSITTAPATANEGDCYYNEAETKIHYYIDGAWDAGAEPQKSKVYFFEDGATIHQYRSDGDKLIEIQDTPQIATNTTVGIVKGGENVNIGADGSINVSFQTIEDKIDEVEQTIQELPEPKEYDVATTTELGLVKASNENDTAEGIAADGNVLVDGNGKMRVRKFIERVENGNEKYMFSVNPDKTIEMLRDGVWKKEIESTISKERTIVSKTFDMQSAAYEGGYIGQFFTEDIEKYFTDGATLESEIKIIPQIIEPQTSVTCKENGLILNDGRTGYTKTETTTYYYVAIRIKDNADVVVYDSLEDDGVVRIESFTKDRLPLKIYAELDIKTTTTTTPAESCTAKGFKPVTTYSCEFSLQGLKQIVTTPIGGANIALCKNGLLIEGAEGEAYVKVLEDGIIEHTFGATQNTGQANVIEQVKVNDVALPIANKSVNVKIAQNGELIEPNAEGVIDIIASGGGSNVSTPDWNQNDETATDYIKNRTHYEEVAEHLSMSDADYDAKIAEGKSFTLVKMNSITIDSNQSLIVANVVQEGSQEEFNNLQNGIYGYQGNSNADINSTLISPKISINGKEVVLNWYEKCGQYYYSSVDTPDGLDTVMYGIGKSRGPNGRYIYAEGFVLKDYTYAQRVNGVQMTGYYGASSYKTFLIDKTIYGEAPYTIDFYFECESVVKKLDEKFLPDGIGQPKPKFKTGDVVYSTNVPNFHFGVMSWEDYVKNPTNSMDTKMPIGLVVDPVKRTFLFCELFGKYFATSDNIETYFGGYTSSEDGSETFERISRLKGTNKAADIPAFYGLRNSGYPSGSIFYVKNEVSYVPATEEWKLAKEHLCTAFYGDGNSYAGFMDRLIALKNGTTPSSSLFIGKHNNGVSKLFYSQLSTVGKTVINGTVTNGVFNMNGEMPNWSNAQDVYACCPVFGIYTEEEENA